MNKFSGLYQRIISAAAGASIIITSLVLSEWSYFIVFMAICLLAQWEFYRLFKLQNYLPIRLLGILIGSILFTLSFLISRGTLDAKYYFALFPMASLIFLVKLYKKNDNNPFLSIALFYLGLTYVVLPFALMNVVVHYHGDYNYEILLGLMLIIWASDTGAYFAGIRFGKRKLFERISPKKSWEGAIGGALTAVAFSVLISRYSTGLAMWQWVSIALIVVIAGTYGDLVESMFKRSIQIKDSGTSIPGHGGFLDRFDSLILAVPFIVVYLKLF